MLAALALSTQHFPRMPLIEAQVDCIVHASVRVREIAGMFDLPVAQRVSEEFSVEVPDLSEAWEIGVIVGPSGSGKSTIARRAFGSHVVQPRPWPSNRAVIDGFAGHLTSGTIARAMTAVGFSSPPAWLKPYAVLSTGEQFRCDLARALLTTGELVVFDEFTSPVDRIVAKTASAALSKAIRTRAFACTDANGRDGDAKPFRFVAVTCHADVIPWLSPDWVVDMSTQTLRRGRLRRPSLRLRVARCGREMWTMFKRHHYLSGELHRAAQCFLGCIDGRPAAFTATLPFPHAHRPGWREHRTVCLPDFQGIGIGNAMSEFVARLYRAAGRPYFSTTAHPAMIGHRMRSPLWRIVRKPGPSHVPGRNSTAPFMLRAASGARITAGFEYVGPARENRTSIVVSTDSECRVGSAHRRSLVVGEAHPAFSAHRATS